MKNKYVPQKIQLLFQKKKNKRITEEKTFQARNIRERKEEENGELSKSSKWFLRDFNNAGNKFYFLGVDLIDHSSENHHRNFMASQAQEGWWRQGSGGYTLLIGSAMPLFIN